MSQDIESRLRYGDYRELLGIGMNDKEKLQKVKNRLFNNLPPFSRYYSAAGYMVYCNRVGECFKGSDYNAFDNAMDSISCSNTIKELIVKYVTFVNSFTNEENKLSDEEKSIKDVLLLIIKYALEEFSIPYDVLDYKGETFIISKGVAEFDDALVSLPLYWLHEFPLAEKAWIKALRAYVEKEDPSSVADLFRKALETFMQCFFEGDQSLENYKPLFGNYLKEHGIDGNLASNYSKILNSYTAYMNDNAKHHDRVNWKALEYLMYETGNIMRLLLQLKKEE